VPRTRLAPLVLLLAACGHPAPVATPSTPAAAPSKLPVGAPLTAPGERMTYRLSLENIDLASFTLVTGEQTALDGKPALLIQSNAVTSSLMNALGQAVDDHFTTWLDPATGRSLAFHVDEGSTTKKGTMEHADARLGACADGVIPATFAEDKGAPASEPQHVKACDDVWDLNAFLFVLRRWEAPAGTVATTEVFRSRFLWSAQVTMGHKESRVTELGELPTLRIDGLVHKLGRDGKSFPDTDDRHFSLWVSDDADRVPVALVARTDYGDIKMEITEYQPGAKR
jgi:hypothetical protein